MLRMAEQVNSSPGTVPYRLVKSKCGVNYKSAHRGEIVCCSGHALVRLYGKYVNTLFVALLTLRVDFLLRTAQQSCRIGVPCEGVRLEGGVISSFIPFRRFQPYPLRVDLKLWLPADDVAHFVAATVAQVPMNAFFVPVRTDGKAQYHSWKTETYNDQQQKCAFRARQSKPAGQGAST